MSEVFERVYNVLDSLGKLFGLLHDSFLDAGAYVSNQWDTVTGFLQSVPGPLLGSVAVIFALGIVLLILGR